MALRVLLADESSTIKRVFEISLKDLGLEIKSVQHGIDVIEVAESFQPDIIFADVLISKMNGYEVCSQIKQHPQLSSVPVVLMWSSFMEIDEDKYSACNADGRLEKPFSNDQLRSKIQSLVPRSLGPVDSASSVAQSTSAAPSAIKKRKDPTEDLLFREDLPLELPEEESHVFSSNSAASESSADFLDPQALNSSLDEDLEAEEMHTASSSASYEDIDPEVTDVDLKLDLSDSGYDDDDSMSDDLGLDGFQALDITGSYNEDLSSRWNDESGLSGFDMDQVHDDDVPLDFSSPTHTLEEDPMEIVSEVTAIPSLEEEAELLKKAEEDSVIRQFGDTIYSLEDLSPSKNPAPAASAHNTAASIKHRSIDELTDPGLVDEMTDASDMSASSLPPVPSKTIYDDPKTAAAILISKEELRALVHKEAKAMLQSVIWDMVPELAKQMIEQELKRLLAEEDPPQA